MNSLPIELQIPLNRNFMFDGSSANKGVKLLLEIGQNTMRDFFPKQIDFSLQFPWEVRLYLNNIFLLLF